jgi:hypothetical protein
MRVVRVQSTPPLVSASFTRSRDAAERSTPHKFESRTQDSDGASRHMPSDCVHIIQVREHFADGALHRAASPIVPNTSFIASHFKPRK